MSRAPLLRDWLAEAPFSLAMSAGFFGFFAHAGILSVLEDHGLLPERFSGASAGALVSGAWAAGIDANRLAEELFRLHRADFWDAAVGPGLLRGALFRARLAELLPVRTFADCRAPVAVTAFDLVARRARALHTGLLAPAIHASCAVPFLFFPVWINGRPFVDGGLTDRAGLAGMPPGKRVLHHQLISRLWPKARSTQALIDRNVPRRPGMTTLVIDALPRVGPFRLEHGVRAFKAAQRGMQRALVARASANLLCV